MTGQDLIKMMFDGKLPTRKEFDAEFARAQQIQANIRKSLNGTPAGAMFAIQHERTNKAFAEIKEMI